MKTKLPKEFVWTIERTKTRYSAFENDFSLYTTSRTTSKLLNQCYEAEALYFNETDEVIHKVRHRFVWSWPSFFTHYKILNARLFADRIGMNASLLSQYIKGTKIPSPQQEQKIIRGIQMIGRELSRIEL